jgi:hypothetical protein
MAHAMTNLVTTEITAEYIRQDGKPESKRFEIKSNEKKINAGVFKKRLVRLFESRGVEEHASPVNETSSDENISHHLIGVDGHKKVKTFNDAEEISLDEFTDFEISPRTTGGIGAHEAALSQFLSPA